MEAPTRKPPDAPPHYTVGSALVALLAILSVLDIAAMQAGAGVKSSSLDDSFVSSVFEWTLVPHLLALVLLTTGLRRTGDLLALAVALLTGAWMVLFSMLGAGDVASIVILLQGAIVLAALVDLFLRTGVRASRQTRLLGLFVPMIVGFVGYKKVATPISEELAWRATRAARQRAAQRGGVRDPSPHRPDSVRLKSVDWITYSALGRLFGMAACIEKFRGDSGGPYPRSLGELKSWSLRDTVSSRKCASELTRSTRDTSLTFLGPADGRIIRYTPPRGPIERYRPAPFTLETESIWDSTQLVHALGRAGLRNFLLDTAGNVHFTDAHRRATLRDPVRPRCNPPDAFVENDDCVVSYPPHRRRDA